MKIIDKILYYFGYAPIRISHEVRYHVVGKTLETSVCRSVFELYEDEYMSLKYGISTKERMERDARIKLIEEINKEGLIEYVVTENAHYPERRFIRVVAELRIVKPLNYGR